jgi:hypothetical protein
MILEGEQRQIPDPSFRTVEALNRELGNLKELFGQRFAAMDQAVVLRRELFDQIPDEIARQIIGLQMLQNEKFTSIAQQFTERDVRSDQATSAAAQALAAALQAAKELVGAQGEASAAAAVKSETSFTKQIDQIGTIIQTLEKALDARITELKERIDRGEGTNAGTRDQHAEERNLRSDQRAGTSSVVGFMGGAVGVIGLLVLLLDKFVK